MSVRRVKYRDRKTGAQKQSWIVDILLTHEDGRVERVRKVSPVQTKRGAAEYEWQLRTAFHRPHVLGREVIRRKDVPTFTTFVDERWFPTYPKAAGNRHTTVAEKESHLRLYLKPFFGAMRLDAIRRESLDRFFAHLVEKKLSPKTLKNVGATLRRILASAVDWEVLDVLPKFPRIKVTESPFDFFTREESDKAISVSRDAEERAILTFAFHTGARAGEQLALEWSDLDWHNRKILIRRSSTRGIVGPTKSGKERKVPMTQTLEVALRAIRHMKGPRVFCRRDGKPLTINQLHERLWGACRRAGLRRIRWHDCRHSFASQLVMANVPIRQVQDWLGHSTILMTMRYSHLAPDGGHELIATLDGKDRRDEKKLWQINGRSADADPHAAKIA